MSKDKGKIVPDYPPEREDWMMIQEYAKKRSTLGCILCDKTHLIKDCEHKAKRTQQTTYQDIKSQYMYDGY